MFLRHYETSSYTVEIFLSNRLPNISFDTCFEMNETEMLPKQFIVRNNKVFCNKKLSKFDNCLNKIIVTGKVDFIDLKKLLPTVFDMKLIKKLNERDFIETNKDQIVEFSKNIVGKEVVEEILSKKLKSEVHNN